MRFDSIEHLHAWRDTGAFPRIHDAISTVFQTEVTGRRLLDLGCSYGLLGAKLLGVGVVDIAVGIDVDLDALSAAALEGIPVVQYPIGIQLDTFQQVADIIRKHQLDAVIARRILPELFGDNLEAGRTFAQLLARAGIQEMVVEGRVVSPTATNPLQSIDQEVRMLQDSWREITRVGAISYLTAR